jgi:RNA polymerase sigma-70 factor (ECF subfamily)
MLGPEMDPGPSDGELVRRLAEGDRQALAELYDRHASTVVGVAVRILKSRREAEDVAHDVFLEAWRRAGSYEPSRASVRGWLLLVTRSRALDRKKSAGFSRGVPLDAEPEDDTVSAEIDVDRGRAVRALAALSPEQQEVIRLGYFEGLSSSEMATELGVPIGTVKSRVRSALATLRGALDVGEVAE